MKNLTSIVLVGLVIAVAVLGYLYYQEQQNDIVIDVPDVKIEQN